MAPTIGRFRMTAMLDNGPSSEPLIVNLPSVEPIPPLQLGRTIQWEAGGEDQGTGFGGLTGGSAYVSPTRKSETREDISARHSVLGTDSEVVASSSRRVNETTPKGGDNDVKASVRLQHKMRAAEHVYWFESTGTKEIPHPPSIAADAGLQKHDIYLHKVLGKDVQSWIYAPQDGKAGPPYQWDPIKQGASFKLPNWKRPRYFVITKGLKPSFVSGSTMTKNYAALEEA